MAYLNNNNNFYSPFAAPNDFDSYPFLQSQTFTDPEEAYCQAIPTFTDSWSTVDQPGSSTNESTNNLGPGYVSPALDSHPTTSLGSFWPADSQFTYTDHPGMASQTDLFAGEQEWETPAQVLIPDPVPDDWWSSQQYGVPMSASRMDNLQNCHNHGPGAIRMGAIGLRRFTPYETYNTRHGMYGNAEAGPSTRLPSPIPHSTWPTIPPTGGESETTADAEQNQSVTEEEETPVPRTRRPRGHGAARPHRERNRGDVRKLREWVKALRGSRELPSHQDAIATAAELISMIWKPVCNGDRLFKGHVQRTGVGSDRAEVEYRRRNGTREVYEKLSRYYPLEGSTSAWTTTQLLVKVLEDIDIMDKTMESLRNLA